MWGVQTVPQLQGRPYVGARAATQGRPYKISSMISNYGADSCCISYHYRMGRLTSEISAHMFALEKQEPVKG